MGIKFYIVVLLAGVSQAFGQGAVKFDNRSLSSGGSGSPPVVAPIFGLNFADPDCHNSGNPDYAWYTNNYGVNAPAPQPAGTQVYGNSRALGGTGFTATLWAANHDGQHGPLTEIARTVFRTQTTLSLQGYIVAPVTAPTVPGADPLADPNVRADFQVRVWDNVALTALTGKPAAQQDWADVLRATAVPRAFSPVIFLDFPLGGGNVAPPNLVGLESFQFFLTGLCVPEPSLIALVVLGAGCLFLFRRRIQPGAAMKRKLYIAVLLATVSQAFGQGAINFDNRATTPGTGAQTPVVAPMFNVDPACVDQQKSGNPDYAWYTNKYGANAPAPQPAGTQVYAGNALSGTGWTATLWAANHDGQHGALTEIARTVFRTQTTLSLQGYFVAPVTAPTVPGVPSDPTSRADFQVRVWDNQALLAQMPGVPVSQQTWADVVAHDVPSGFTPVIFLDFQLGGGPDSLPPPNLIGLESFQLHLRGADVCIPEPSLIALGVLGAGCLFLFRRRRS